MCDRLVLLFSRVRLSFAPMQMFYKANSLAPSPLPISYYTDTAANPQTTAVLAANPASAFVPVAAPSTNATILYATTLNIPAAGRAE